MNMSRVQLDKQLIVLGVRHEMNVLRDVWNCKSWKIIRVNLDSGQIRYFSGILKNTTDISRDLLK